MSLHNKILTYMIENLGLPLMGAVGTLQKKSSTPESDAEVMAKMLTSSVDLGMAISAKMNISSDVNKAEALRFKLTSLSAHALADRISLKGKEPSSIDIDSLKATTDSIFVFSENFSIDENAKEYLEKMGLQDIIGTELSQLHLIQALLPVIAVMDHKDRGLFPNIAERLINESDALSAQFSEKSDSAIGSELLVRYQVLTLLSETFIRIYPDIINNNKPIGDVWQEFDRQKALVVLLMDYLMSGQRTVDMSESGEGGTAPVNEVEQVQAPVPPAAPSQQQTPPPMFQKPPSPPPTAEKAESEGKKEEGSTGGGTPLSFFKKE